MYRTTKDFLEDWEYETESTVKLLNNLTQNSLDTKVTDNGRSIKKLVWHIIQSNPEMLVHAGVKVDGFDDKETAPNDLSELIKQYISKSELVNNYVSKNLSDNSLEEDVKIYGDVWKKGKLLSSIINHQIHHRAQITVLMRQAGLKVPGIYGPSKEEWEIYGMEAQD